MDLRLSGIQELLKAMRGEIGTGYLDSGILTSSELLHSDVCDNKSSTLEETQSISYTCSSHAERDDKSEETSLPSTQMTSQDDLSKNVRNPANLKRDLTSSGLNDLYKSAKKMTHTCDPTGSLQPQKMPAKATYTVLTSSKSNISSARLEPRLMEPNVGSTSRHCKTTEIEHKPGNPVNEVLRSNLTLERQNPSSFVTEMNQSPSRHLFSTTSTVQVARDAPGPNVGCDGSLSDVKVVLEREDLWKIFHEQGNEMIVSKPGRAMFPTLDLKVSGLLQPEVYKIAVRLVYVDEHRYRYFARGAWDRVEEGRKKPDNERSRCFEHPESPACGQHWNERRLSFRKLLLTNHRANGKNMVYASTLRKHRVQLLVTMPRCTCCSGEHTRHVDIPLTDFIAVSGYYNSKIKQLKITHNATARKRWQPKRQKATDITSHRHAYKVYESNRQLAFSPSVPINLFESTQVIMTSLQNDYPCNTSSAQLSTASHLETSCILPSSTFSTIVLQNTLSSQVPSMLSQPVFASSTCTSSIIQSASLPCNVLSTTTYPPTSSDCDLTRSQHCNVVYTCQTAKPTAHVQTDDDILQFIRIYLAPFQTAGKHEVFDWSIFDELNNITYISDGSLDELQL